MKSLHIDKIPDETMHALKVGCAAEKSTIKGMIIHLINRHCGKYIGMCTEPTEKPEER